MCHQILSAFIAIATALCGSALGAAHELAPLSQAEMEHAVAALRSGGSFSNSDKIASLTLVEPPKAENEPHQRLARAVLVDHLHGRSTEVLLGLDPDRIIATQPITNGQPMELPSEFIGAMDYIRKSPDWIAAMRHRGITNVDDVFISLWAGGHQEYAGTEGRRFGRGLAYFKGKQKNEQGPPIEGVEAIVDLDRQKVLRVIDTGPRKLPPDSTDFYNPAIRGTGRKPLKPLVISQPEGPGFELDGFEVSWDRWRFLWSFNSREGLVLHKVRYLDGDRPRSILHRASISEMLVPYGSPEDTWFWRNAVDEGEYGLGNSAYPLVPGETAPPHVTLLDIPSCGDDGTVSMAKSRVGLYEQVHDTLWSHSSLSGETIGRPSRELVIYFLATVGNYDYRFSWIFRQDGGIQFEVALTGILLMGGTDAEKCAACSVGIPTPGIQRAVGDQRFGTLVARNTIATHHQHFVNLRLDFDIDGRDNCVKELNTAVVPGKRANPHKNAWEVVSSVFGRESEATRDLSSATSRHWAIFNPNTRTDLGHFPSYLLEPAGNTLPLMAPGTRSRRLLGFINHPFHVTRFHERELFAGGDYPNQVTHADNVETWTADNESIINQDLVVWYTFGITHIPRPEEFPVMPTTRAGFTLLPHGFFNRNPALDVPKDQ
jgi:primary-amine oxidase